MNFLCKCGATFGINFISYMPECPRCGSDAAMAPNENIGHVDDDNLCHRDTSVPTSFPDRALRDAPADEELLFLAAWMVFVDCSYLEE